MDTKLTLKLDKSVIEQAKKYARKKKKSLSKIVEYFFKMLVQEEEYKNREITPLVEELSGIIKGDFDYSGTITDYLMEKHNL